MLVKSLATCTVYIQPFLRYSKSLVENCNIFTPHLCLAAPQGVTPSEFREDLDTHKIRMNGLSLGEESRYIHDLIHGILSNLHVHATLVVCFIIFWPDDDLVLLAASWSALQHFISLQYTYDVAIDMTCNVTKTVCMVLSPVCKRKALSCAYPIAFLQFQPGWLCVLR